MRILVTNDDGINATGLACLEAIAQTLAGPSGEVWVVAPTAEKSGVAHCISYTTPMMINTLGPKRYSVDGYPADCVLAALHHIMINTPPDVILSGVNRGNNSAENALYSGTLGAALEGALQGVPSFALSQYFGVKNRDLADPFEAAATFGASVVKDILEASVPNDHAYPLFYNINFPPVAASEVKGRKVAPQGYRDGVRFSAQAHQPKSGRQFLFVSGGDQTIPTAQGTDAQVNLDGYISITPMRADFTAYDAIEALKDIE